jgi:branched-chain amino acid transport system substrate-binding protein
LEQIIYTFKERIAARNSALFNSKALTKLQSAVLIAAIVVAAVSGGLAYVLLNGQQPADAIKIGICADIDSSVGKGIWQGAVLAAEQVNADGGVLGRNFTIVGEDDDDESPSMDSATAISAFTRLITVDKADYVVYSGIGGLSITFQDLASQHKTIMFGGVDPADELTQRVLDDYDNYKYFFRVGIPNATSANDGVTESIRVLRNYTGFNKVAFVYQDPFGNMADGIAGYTDTLLGYGFEVVYTANVPLDTVDFSSYFAQAEAAGAEILYPLIVTPAAVSFVKEYYDRQSPMVMWGLISLASQSNFWEVTEGKCEYVSANTYPTVVGYPLTNKTVLFGEAYMERWNEPPPGGAIYDLVRYILPDALKRAGTTETEAVIKALETTSVETSLARRFVFTSSHDITIGAAGPNRPGEDYYLVCVFQWQNGKLVPVYPEEIKEEASVTYALPDWQGPWTK